MKIPHIVDRILRLTLDPDYKKMAPIPIGPGDFKIPFLSDDELKMVNGFKAQKKQIEWLCGRFSLKTLVQEFCCKDSALFDICISYQEKGAPFLNLYPDIPISLSHSGDFTVAAICPGRRINLGIDIEKIGKTPETFFMKTAFTQKEISHMAPFAHEIYRHWTLKEAFLKYIKMGFNENLHRVEIIDNKIFYQGQQQELSFWSTTIENRYILSMVADPL
ncbi:MAG: 4'-phosphopantetheinyl transferase superfamily protein [Proteobacteria bacterium]|nr:4'-phosphopantetheinyl transferase superfamily protein [Pseudomonadota bacterium]MBU4130839.1 4'-phosphopantetheinyl transferase superfamily protein [Pseudomonadota bacterium]